MSTSAMAGLNGVLLIVFEQQQRSMVWGDMLTLALATQTIQLVYVCLWDLLTR